MSRRFGRNQRRKMREQIADKDHEIGVLRESYSEAANRSRERGQRLQAWAEDVLRLMGPDSAFNEQVRRMAVDEGFAAGGRMRLRPVMPLMPVSRDARPLPPMSVETVINALIWRLHMSKEEFRPMIRIELENRYAEPVGYALAEDHRWTEKDVRYLAERIAREMTDLLNSGVDKRKRRA